MEKCVSGGYGFPIVLEREKDWYVAHCKELGIASQGRGIREAKENLKEAVELYLKHATPEELTRIERYGQ